jgi:hypothetical protein
LEEANQSEDKQCRNNLHQTGKHLTRLLFLFVCSFVRFQFVSSFDASDAQMVWTKAIYVCGAALSLLLVLDTNFQLSVYTHAMELIMTNAEHYQTPRPGHTSENQAIFIENVKRISHQCVDFVLVLVLSLVLVLRFFCLFVCLFV